MFMLVILVIYKHRHQTQDWFDYFINRGAPFRWSFGPHSAWSSIESTTILTTHPSSIFAKP